MTHADTQTSAPRASTSAAAIETLADTMLENICARHARLQYADDARGHKAQAYDAGYRVALRDALDMIRAYASGTADGNARARAIVNAGSVDFARRDAEDTGRASVAPRTGGTTNV